MSAQDTSSIATANTEQGNILLLDQHAVIQYADANIEYRRGFSPAEVYLKNPNQLWGGNMKNRFYKTFWQNIQTQHITQVSLKNRHANGRLLHEQLTIVRLPTHSGTYYIECEVPAAKSQAFTHFAQALNQKEQTTFKDLTIIFHNFLQLDTGVSKSTEQLINQYKETSKNTFSDRTIDASIFNDGQSKSEKIVAYYDRYFAIVLSYFLARTSKEEAEDLTHDVFLSAWTQFGAYRPLASYKTYLLRIAHNRYVDWLRHQAVRSTVQIDAEYNEQALEPSFTHRIEWILLKDHMTTEERELLIKHYFQGYKIKEIADSWGMTENAIKLRISRLRRRLRKAS